MARRLAEGVWLLDLGWVPPFATNAYLVDDGEVTLVDAGLPRRAGALTAEFASAGYGPADIDRVLVTHYDLDHTGGLGRLSIDAPVYIGAADAALLAGDAHPPLVHPKGAFHRIARRLFPLPDGLEVRRVDDGDVIGGFTAYHTPGHNPGHTVYIHEALEAGLLGDLVWEDDGELTPPIWFDSYDVAELYESIRQLAARAPDFELACMGHGTPLLEGGAAALRRLAERLA